MVAVTPAKCLACGRDLDRATGVKDRTHEFDETILPNPGDVTICFGCGHIMAFGANLELCELNAEQAREIAGNKTLLALQRALGNLRRMHKPTPPSGSQGT